MEVIIRQCVYSPCHLEVFTINGIDANKDDFGYLDSYCGECEDYCCSNRRFIIDESNKEKVMWKYHLTEAEYDMVCSKLETECYIYACGYCI